MHGRPRSKIILGCFVLPVLSFAALGCERPGRDPDPVNFPLPADGSTMSRDELGDLKAALKNRGKTHYHSREGVACKKKCVDVEIESIGRTNDIDETDGPQSARIVAEIRNNHKTDIATKYGLKPTEQADYYMWVDRASSGAARWTIVELRKIEGGMAEVNYGGRQGSLFPCHDSPPEGSDADFKSCAPHKDTTAAIKRSGLVSIPGFASMRAGFWNLIQKDTSTAPGDDPAWLRCVNGCCTTEQQM